MFPYFNLDFFIDTSVYWMPFVAVLVLWEIWLYYIRALYVHKLEWVLLEIKFPRDIIKTPAAMEVVLSAIHQTSDGNFIEKFWKGKLRPWFSLEITSFSGEIHFYIRAEKKFKNLIESQIYSQYPGIEIYLVDDYTGRVPFGVPGSDWNIFASEFSLTKADPYPIKTYIDYGLDKEPGEAGFPVDPITPIIEMMGNIRPGEEFWLQYLVMATKDRDHKAGTWFGRQGWKDQGQKLVNEIMKRDPSTKSSKQTSAAGFPVIPTLSKGEQATIEAIERNISKLGFDVGMRMIYLARQNVFDKINISSMFGCVKHFNSTDMNGFKPGFKTDFDFPWEDFNGWRLAYRKRNMFDAYRRRSYFYPPYPSKPFVLNTEELATVFHFPGQLAQTPNLGRIESKRAEPPSNLPI